MSLRLHSVRNSKRGASLGLLAERGHQLLGDLARFAASNRAIVERDHGNDFASGARKECLVRRIDVERSEEVLGNRVAFLAADVDQGLASNAGEDSTGGMRRANSAVLNDKDVIARTLCDLAL